MDLSKRNPSIDLKIKQNAFISALLIFRAFSFIFICSQFYPNMNAFKLLMVIVMLFMNMQVFYDIMKVIEQLKVFIIVRLLSTYFFRKFVQGKKNNLVDQFSDKPETEAEEREYGDKEMLFCKAYYHQCLVNVEKEVLRKWMFRWSIKTLPVLVYCFLVWIKIYGHFTKIDYKIDQEQQQNQDENNYYHHNHNKNEENK